MSRQKQPDNILEGLIFIIFLIPIGVYYVIKWILMGIIWLIAQCVKVKQHESFNIVNMDEVDNLDGISFEHYIADLLSHNGYSQVQVTKASGDFGVDILAHKGDDLWAFQCKCYHSSVGVHAVQEVYSGAQKYGANIVAVITNSYFTPAAHELAEDLDIELWDRKKLCELLNNSKHKDSEKKTLDLEVSERINSNESEIAVSTQQEDPKDKLILKLTDNESGKDCAEMATIIGAGKYVFGEDIPLGKYNLKVVSGSGMLTIREGKTEDDEEWINMGLIPDFAHEYRNLSLKQGEFFTLSSNLQVEISRAKMLEIDP